MRASDEGGYYRGMKKIHFLLGIPALIPAPAIAEVRNADDNGFVIFHTAEISTSPEAIWQRLIVPKDWWQKEHSWSGSSEGFYIEPKAGGCFCETFLEKQENGDVKNTGSVEHMRVIFAQAGKVLRMQGALGPLQSEAVTGTFTVAMAPQPGGKSSKISFSYVVGGYMRYKGGVIAPAVDKVLAAQFASLIAPFNVVKAAAQKPADWSLDLGGVTGDTKGGADDPGGEISGGDIALPPNDTGQNDPANISANDPSGLLKPPAGKQSKPRTKGETLVTDPATSAKKER